MPNEKSSGWSRAEMLLALLVFLLLCLPSVPSLVGSLQRGRQIQTMRDIRAIATAVEAYAVESHVYPAGGCDVIATANATTISTQVTPTYIRQIPEKDAWGTTFYYGTTNNSQLYQIRSVGGNATYETNLDGPTSAFPMDIVFENGKFVVFPEGAERHY